MKKLTINIFIVNYSSYMYKFLSSIKNYVYKACNPIILTYLYLKKDKFRIIGLQA
jgi:hypothetical protein